MQTNARSGSQLQTGKKIKNYLYHYCDLIGHGNFAKVFKGHNINSQKVVAIKMISLDELKNQHLEELVFEQIRILQLLRHPNILSFVEALLSERNCYIVSELCREGNLDDRIKKRTGFAEQQIGAIVLDIWHGLKYMREKGVAHRDLKPANIFMDKGRAIIADFGLAKFHKQRFKDLDIGSPQYMSPEGIMLQCYSQKTDIWSLGIILYEMLHGQTPFAFCQKQHELKYNVTRPIPENRWRKDITPPLRQFINRCLEIDQTKRPNVFQLSQEPFLKYLLQRQAEKQSGQLLSSQVTQASQLLQQESHRKQESGKSISQINIGRPASYNSHQHRTKQQFYPKTNQYDSVQNDRASSSGGKKFNFRKQLSNQPASNESSKNQSVGSSFSKKDGQKYHEQNNGHASTLLNQKISFQIQPGAALKEANHLDRSMQFNTPQPKTSHIPYDQMRTSPKLIRRELCEKTSQTNQSEDERRQRTIQLSHGRLY